MEATYLVSCTASLASVVGCISVCIPAADMYVPGTMLGDFPNLFTLLVKSLSNEFDMMVISGQFDFSVFFYL